MNAGADDHATLRQVPKRGDDQIADRCEDDRRVELLRRAPTRPARPPRSHRPRESLPLLVSVASEGVHLPPFCPRHLHKNLGRRSEAVEADALRVAGQPQRAESDESGAQQRRRFLRAVAVGQRKAVARIGDAVLRVSAVNRVAGEACTYAEILATGCAVAALSVGPS